MIHRNAKPPVGATTWAVASPKEPSDAEIASALQIIARQHPTGEVWVMPRQVGGVEVRFEVDRRNDEIL